MPQAPSKKTEKAASSEVVTSPSVPVDLFQTKIAYLLKLANIRREDFVIEFQQIGDPRMAAHWVADGSDPKIPYHKPIKRNLAPIAKRFSKYLGISNELPDKLFLDHYSLDDMRKWVESSGAMYSKEASARHCMTFELTGPLHPFSKKTRAILRGNYFIYRFSFAGEQDHPRVVREVLSIDDGNDDALFMKMRMFGFPTYRNRAKDVQKGVEIARFTELFTGRLYWFGHSFNGHVFHSENNEDQKSRCLLFPYVNVLSFAHYGLITGYSVLMGAPVSVKAVAIKTSHFPLWNDATDIAKIRRYDVTLDPGSWNEEIAPYIPFLDNRLLEEDFSVLAAVAGPKFVSLRNETLRTLGEIPLEA